MLEKRVIRINGILETRDQGIEVEFKDGGRAWLPRDHVEFYPGRVVVPAWLFKKMKGEK